MLSADGDPLAGSFAFAVGSGRVAAASTARDTPTTPGETGIALLRGLLFVALALGFGGPVMNALLPRGPRTVRPPPPLRAAGWLGTLATVGLIGYLASEGSPGRGLSDTGLAQLTGSTPGRVLLAELVAFAVTLVLARRTPPLLAVVPMLVVLVAEGIRAHPAETAGALGVVLLVTHLSAAALWAGGLVQTLRVATASYRQGARAEAWASADRYAATAALLFALVVLTGTVQSLVLIRDLAGFTDTGYGRVLLGKIALVLLIAGLALSGRVRLRRALTPEPFGRRTRLEAGALIVVLLLTGALVTQAPPPRGQAVTLPPPPIEPVLWQGRLLGHITVGVGASEGQVRINAATPDQGRSEVTITARLTTPGTESLRLRRCGDGCFTVPVSWQAGTNGLALAARAPGWAGGSTTLRIDWPPRSEPRRLDALRQRLGTVRRLVFSTTVDSGPGGHVTPLTLTVTGRRYLDSSPWGRAPLRDVITVTRPGGTDLYFALPEESVYVQLTLDTQGRLLAEHVVTHNHDIRNVFQPYR